MINSSYSPVVTAAKPIQVLIINPDDTYETRTVEQDLKTIQSIVGGWIDMHYTPSCVFRMNADAKDSGCPINALATYFWWDRDPSGDTAEFGSEGDPEDMLRGPVLVTGSDDDDGHPLPVSDDVIEYFERLRAIYMEHKEDG